MKKILFVCEWGKNKQTSWSGTHFSLFKSLSENAEVIDFFENLNLFESFIIKIVRNIDKLFDKKFKLDISVFTNFIYNIFLERKYKPADYVIFQFSAIPINKKFKSYIYQDLNYEFLIEEKSNNYESYKHSGFQYLTDKQLQKKKQWQDLAYCNYTAIFTMSKCLSEFIQSNVKYRSKVYHVGGGSNIDTSLYSKKSKQRKRILFIGKDFERKNGKLVIEAFRKLKLLKEDVELYIIGPDKIDCDEDGIIFLGNLKYDEIPYYLNLCDIFCLPSIFEAYGLVFAEALSFGLPCIGLNAYEMKNFITSGKNGYLLDSPDNSDELSNLLDKALKNKAMYDYVEKHRAEYISNFKWDSVAKKIINVINISEKNHNL